MSELGLVILDVAIGLIFTFLIFSLIVTATTEVLANLFRLRARTLKLGLQWLLEEKDGLSGLYGLFVKARGVVEPPVNPQAATQAATGNLSDLAEKVLRHPLINKLTTGNKVPSYIEPRMFVAALLDALNEKFPDPNAPPDKAAMPLSNPIAILERLPSGNLKTALLAMISDARADADKIVAELEGWYDSSMDRIGGWYRKNMHSLSLLLGFAIAVAFNVDALHVAQRLYTDAPMRAAVVELASQAANNDEFMKACQPAENAGGQTAPAGQPGAEADPAFAAIACNAERIQTLLDQTSSLPIGWSVDNLPTAPFGWLFKLFGFFVTALAISLGAPFWFGLLQKIVNIRATGTSPKEKSA